MDKYEKLKIKSCLETIDDKLTSINMEMLKENPYKGYILEKARPILNDIQVIINICS